MRNAIKQILEFIANSNLFISASSFYFTLFCCEGLSVSSEITNAYALIVALSVFFIYGLQRLYFVKLKPALTSRQHWYKRHFGLMTVLVVISAVSIIPLLFLFPVELIFYFIFPAIASLLYYLGPWPLRKTFAIKGFVIGLVWAASCVVIPFYIFQPETSVNNMLLLAGAAFFFVAALCIPFDIRDLEEDRTKKIKSIPVIYGMRISVITGITLTLLFVILISIGKFSADSISAGISTGIITAIAIAFSNPQRNRFYFSLFVDGLLFVPFLLLRLFQLLE